MSTWENIQQLKHLKIFSRWLRYHYSHLRVITSEPWSRGVMYININVHKSHMLPSIIKFSTIIDGPSVQVKEPDKWVNDKHKHACAPNNLFSLLDQVRPVTRVKYMRILVGSQLNSMRKRARKTDDFVYPIDITPNSIPPEKYCQFFSRLINHTLNNSSSFAALIGTKIISRGFTKNEVQVAIVQGCPCRNTQLDTKSDLCEQETESIHDLQEELMVLFRNAKKCGTVVELGSACFSYSYCTNISDNTKLQSIS